MFQEVDTKRKANGQCDRIYLHSLPVKEYQIIDFFLPKLKDEVMKIKPVQKQTRAGQRTRFKACVFPLLFAAKAQN
jgi:ribosomal protein S5